MEFNKEADDGNTAEATGVQYSYEIIPTDETVGTFECFCFAGNGWYAVSMDKTGENIPQEAIDEAKKNGEEFVNDGRYDTYERSLRFVGLNGEVRRLEQYSAIMKEVNRDERNHFSSVNGFGSMAVDENGDIISLEYNSTSWYDDPNSVEFSTVWYLSRLDGETGRREGKKLIRNESGLTLTADTVLYDKEHLFVTASKDGKNCIAEIDMRGNIVKTIECSDNGIKLLRLGDGSPAICGFDGSSVYIRKINTKTSELEMLAQSSSGLEYAYNGFNDFAFSYSFGWKLYGFSPLTGEDGVIITWPEMGLSAVDNLTDLNAAEDESIYFINSGYKGTDGKRRPVIVKLSRNDEMEEKGKTELLLLSAEPSHILQDAVAVFNASDTEYVIKLEDYLSYYPDLDRKNALDRYLAERSDRRQPDILDLTGLQSCFLAESGVLQDLYPFIDADVELDRDSFIQGLLKALEYNGGLYESCAGFTIDTVIGTEEKTGSSTGWSYGEYRNAVEKMGAGCRVFDIYTGPEEILYAYLQLKLDDFIDYKTCTCTLTGTEFEDIIDMAQAIPVKSGTGEYSSDLAIRDGRQMLLRTCIYGVDDALRAGFEFGKEISYKGLPIHRGSGSSFNTKLEDMVPNMAIFAAGMNQNGAWSFVRSFLTEDYQSGLKCFPSNLAVFNRRLEDAMRVEYLHDSNGNIVLGKKTQEPVERSKGTMYLSDFTAVKYYAMSQTNADKLTGLIAATTDITRQDDNLFGLVSSAVKPYFEGNSTKDEAVSAAEKAVNLYLRGTAT